MIEIQCFNEAHQLYIQSKISFRLMQDQAAVLFGLCQHIKSSFNTALEITHADINLLLKQPEASQYYSDYLGGHTYICETEQDLLLILGCDFAWAETHNGNWPNVTDIAMSWDACEFLPETEGEPQWMMFLLCWNNAGGPVYYIPKHLWTQAKVTDHIAATNPSNTN